MYFMLKPSPNCTELAIYSVNVAWSVHQIPKTLTIQLQWWKNILMSWCLTRTSDNSKYFLWSHRLRVNEFQLYVIPIIVTSDTLSSLWKLRNIYFTSNIFRLVPESLTMADPTEAYRPSRGARAKGHQGQQAALPTGNHGNHQGPGRG